MIECCDGSGFHSVLPEQLFNEIIEPESGNRLAYHESGHVAVTHLNRRGTVFLRCLIGDVASLDHAPCPHCGRTSVRMSSAPVRTGDIVKIKGALVNLGNLKSEFDRKQEIDEYQIVVSPADQSDAFSMDELIIRLAPAKGSGAAVAEQIAADVIRLTNLRPRIEIVDRDEIFNPLAASKPRRIIDTRQPRL